MTIPLGTGPDNAEIFPSAADLTAAVFQTVLYADLFDYPLTPAEAHRFLIAQAGGRAAVAAAFQQASARGLLTQSGPWYMLPDRGHLAEIRRRRNAVAAWKWPQARRHGRHIAALPFVRFVGVTGSLAMDNAEAHEDIDYFIVTEPGRLWLTRGLVILLTRLARRAGVELCPNYLVTTGNLDLPQRDLFSAHELAQMVPLAGRTLYGALLLHNSWARAVLPNSFPHPQASAMQARGERLRWTERALHSSLGDRLEAWERERKVRRLQQRAQREGGSVVFTPDACKGHFGDRDRRIVAAYRERLDRLGVPYPPGLAAADAPSGRPAQSPDQWPQPGLGRSSQAVEAL